MVAFAGAAGCGRDEGEPDLLEELRSGAGEYALLPFVLENAHRVETAPNAHLLNLEKLERDPRHAALAAALAASGASPARLEAAMTGATYHETGRPEDLHQKIWAQGRGEVLAHARSFVQRLRQAEAAGHRVDWDELERRTGLVSLARVTP